MAIETGNFGKVLDALVNEGANGHYPAALIGEYKRGHRVPLRVYALLESSSEGLIPPALTASYNGWFPPEKKGLFGGGKPEKIETIEETLAGLYDGGYVTRTRCATGWAWKVKPQEPVPAAPATPAE
jgi:hypothetical protein